jgi:class 3 adenylate cyclase
MLPKPESACFVIADISGYTGFLAGVELEPAQDIIADLMDTMCERLRRSGQREVGTVNHCMHGPHAIIEEVPDRRRSITLRFRRCCRCPMLPR